MKHLFYFTPLFLLCGVLGCGQPTNNGSRPDEIENITLRNHPSPSPDGTQMVYHVPRLNDRVGLYISRIDGTEERLLFGSDSMHAQEPRWSPDGQLIAFVGGDDYKGNKFALYVIRPDGLGLREVHRPDEGLAKSPFWKSDGRYLSYAERNQAAGWAKVHIIGLDGSDHQILPLTGEGLHYHPRWGHASNRFLISWRTPDNDTDGNLYIIDPAEPDLKEWVTNHPGIEGMPAWSPDERFIVYNRGVHGTNQDDLFLLDLTNGTEINLTNTPDASEYFPTYSANGETLFYQRFEQVPSESDTFVSKIIRLPFDRTAYD